MKPGEQLKAEASQAKSQESELKKYRDPLDVASLPDREDKARKIKKDIEHARAKKSEILAKFKKLNPDSRKFDEEKRELEIELQKATAPILNILNNIIGLNILLPTTETELSNARKEFSDSINKPGKPDFDPLLSRGKALEVQGKNPASPNVVEELSGMIMEEQAIHLKSESAKYDDRRVDDETLQRAREGARFADLSVELAELTNNNEGGVYNSQISGIKTAIEMQLTQETKAGGYLEQEFNLSREWERRLNAAKASSRDDLYDELAQISVEVRNAQKAAKTQDAFAASAHDSRAGMKTRFLSDRLDRIYRGIADGELKRIEDDMNALGRAYAAGTSGLSQESFINRMRGMSAERSSLNRQISADMMSGGRQAFYESLPEDRGQWREWVWEKIASIDSAGISPAMLVYSPDWSSLLYAMPQLASFDKRLSGYVQAWRTVYEMNIQMDGAGSSAEMMASAPNLDVDAIIGLLGSRTPEGILIRKAFAKFDARGKEFVSSTAVGRENIKDTIARELNDYVRSHPDEFGGGNYLFGEAFEKIAYRYWKLFGREAIFDDVFAGKKRKDGNGVKWEIDNVAGDTTIGLGVSARRDRAVREAHKVRSPGEPISQQKYAGYIGESKFWFRRLLNFPHGVRVEQNLEFMPEMYDRVDLMVRDFFTTHLINPDLKRAYRQNYTDGRKFTDGKSVALITEDMLAPIEDSETGVDYTNVAWKYAVYMDAVNKASKTRDVLIATGGILEKPTITDADLKSLRDQWQHVGEKDETILVSIAEGFIELHRDRGLNWSVDPQYGPDNKSQAIPHIHKFRSLAGELTGVDAGALSRSDIESLINKMINIGFVGPHAGEMLKRKYLGIGEKKIIVKDPETGKEETKTYPLIYGVGPVRWLRGAPGTLLEFIFKFTLGFVQGAAGQVANDMEKNMGK